MKKTIALLLALITVLLCVAACNKEKQPEETKKTEGVTTIYEVQDSEEQPDIPADLKFGSEGAPAVVHILERKPLTGVTAEFLGSTDSEKGLDLAVFERNERIKNRLNVTLEVEQEDGYGSGTSINKFLEKVRVLNEAQMGETFIIASPVAYSGRLAQEGCFYNLYNLNPEKTNYLGLQHSWWNQGFIKSADIKNNLYFVAGEATFSFYERMFVLIYNVELADTMCKDGDGNSYDFSKLVYDGKWTWEVFLNCLKSVGIGDVNDMDNSYWGLTAIKSATGIDGFVASMDITITMPDSDGRQRSCLTTGKTNGWNEERLETLRKLFNENPSVYTNTDRTQIESPFVKGRAVFYATQPMEISKNNIQTMSDEFALLPMPKYTEDQEYIVCSHNEYSVLAVLSSSIDTDVASAVMELMSYESMKSIRPVLFEKTYLKKLQTEENLKMFNFILDHVTDSFAQIYGSIFGLPFDYCREVAMKNTSPTSMFAAREEKTRTRLDAFLDAFYVTT